MGLPPATNHSSSASGHDRHMLQSAMQLLMVLVLVIRLLELVLQALGSCSHRSPQALYDTAPHPPPMPLLQAMTFSRHSPLPGSASASGPAARACCSCLTAMSRT